jgi:predicted DNA-binding transcriptional regulator AlpA
LRILTKKEAAQRNRISLRLLERLIASGEGPPIIQLGARRVGIDEDDNDAWLRSRRRQVSLEKPAAAQPGEAA